jgi:hypothetical protein
MQFNYSTEFSSTLMHLSHLDTNLKTRSPQISSINTDWPNEEVRWAKFPMLLPWHINLSLNSNALLCHLLHVTPTTCARKLNLPNMSHIYANIIITTVYLFQCNVNETVWHCTTFLIGQHTQIGSEYSVQVTYSIHPYRQTETTLDNLLE